MRIVIGGDAIIVNSLRLLLEAGSLAEVHGVLAAADAAVLNCETLFHSYDLVPAAEGGGGWLGAPPDCARDLAGLGVRLMSLANNHAGDFGTAGLMNTIHSLSQAGIACSGAGADLDAARTPAVVSAGSARLALVSVTTTCPPHARAALACDGMPGRPGVSYLRHKAVHELPVNDFRELARIIGSYSGQRHTAEAGKVVIEGRIFRAAEAYRIITWCHSADLNDLCASIRRARELADVVVVSVHSHEYYPVPSRPPDFLVQLGRAAIENGAHVVACHGPHEVRGMEIYAGQPIFYGLGSIFFQVEQIVRAPFDERRIYDLPLDAAPELIMAARPGFRKHEKHWEGVLGVCEIGRGPVSSVRLIPLELDSQAGDRRTGLPRVAVGDRAARIIQRVAGLSALWGTSIDPDGRVLMEARPHDAEKGHPGAMSRGPSGHSPIQRGGWPAR